MRDNSKSYGPLGVQPVRRLLTLPALCEASGLSPGPVSRAVRGWHRSPRLVKAAIKLTGLPANELFTPAFLAPLRSALRPEEAEDA